MCGFVGFTNFIGEKADRVLEDMMNKIVHRGPDSSGKFVNEDICLGFRRLSIIDLEGGSQPLYNEDGTMILVFNGEIYNHRELRDELIERGHIFKTRTDSETLLHGFEEYGEELPSRLRGMFSFVILDTKTKTLLSKMSLLF